MIRMFNPAHPAHPDKVLIAEAAAHLGMTRTAISRILNESEGISAETALPLEAALGSSAEIWLDRQRQIKHELWEASKKPRCHIKPLVVTAVTKIWALKPRGRPYASA